MHQTHLIPPAVLNLSFVTTCTQTPTFSFLLPLYQPTPQYFLLPVSWLVAVTAEMLFTRCLSLVPIPCISRQSLKLVECISLHPWVWWPGHQSNFYPWCVFRSLYPPNAIHPTRAHSCARFWGWCNFKFGVRSRGRSGRRFCMYFSCHSIMSPLKSWMFCYHIGFYTNIYVHLTLKNVTDKVMEEQSMRSVFSNRQELRSPLNRDTFSLGLLVPFLSVSLPSPRVDFYSTLTTKIPSFYYGRISLEQSGCSAQRGWIIPLIISLQPRPYIQSVCKGVRLWSTECIAENFWTPHIDCEGFYFIGLRRIPLIAPLYRSANQKWDIVLGHWNSRDWNCIAKNLQVSDLLTIQIKFFINWDVCSLRKYVISLSPMETVCLYANPWRSTLSVCTWTTLNIGQMTCSPGRAAISQWVRMVLVLPSPFVHHARLLCLQNVREIVSYFNLEWHWLIGVSHHGFISEYVLSLGNLTHCWLWYAMVSYSGGEWSPLAFSLTLLIVIVSPAGTRSPLAF